MGCQNWENKGCTLSSKSPRVFERLSEALQKSKTLHLAIAAHTQEAVEWGLRPLQLKGIKTSAFPAPKKCLIKRVQRGKQLLFLEKFVSRNILGNAI